MIEAVEIEGRRIGPGHPALLVAEVSANHDRDLGQALALVDVAADCGADAIKLQTYTADSLAIRTNHPSAKVDPVWGADTLYELYEKAAMPMEFHEPLFARARERGLLPFSTIYDERDLDFLEELGNPVYKIASFELVHHPLLRRVAETGRPVILSTGMASLAEVGEAVGALREGGCLRIVLLHCCSAYPAPFDSVNLAAMATLREAFQVPVGFSDHTLGAHVALAAVMLGACVIEKHFTNDSRRPGPDHRFSADPETLARMVREIREAEAAVGSPDKGMTAAEAVNRSVGRRSIFAVRDIAQGEVILPDMIRVVRPGAGLHPRHLEEVLGRRARRAVTGGHPVTWEAITGDGESAG